MDLIEEAVEIKHLGYNCCQAVVKVLAPLTNVDEQTLSVIGSAFGAGMGCMEGTCGALIGAGIIAGLVKEGIGSAAASREILQRFESMCGATICKDLKGRDTGKVLCPCDDCVRNAVKAFLEVFPQ